MNFQLSANDNALPKGTKLTATDTVAVFTAPARGKGHAKGSVLIITNTTANTPTATVEWYDATNTVSYTIRSALAFTANQTHEIDLYGMALGAGDEIRVTPSSVDELHCVVVAHEIHGNQMVTR